MEFQENDIVVLCFLQKYGFLTIKQTARIIEADQPRHISTVGKRLRMMGNEGYVSSFGYVQYGAGKAPKVYYLKKKGYDFLIENRIPEELLGKFKERSKPKWSPVFSHRLQLIDVFLSLEVDIRKHPELELIKVFMDYNRIDGYCETMDFVAADKIPENKIIPDGAFILKSHKTEAVAIYFIELDKGTESITSRIAPNDRQTTLYARMKKYDRYLMSGNFKSKYAEWGNFEAFRLLFITTSSRRMMNIRKKLFDLPRELHVYYLFNTYDVVKGNFFNKEWQVRSLDDEKKHGIF